MTFENVREASHETPAVNIEFSVGLVRNYVEQGPFWGNLKLEGAGCYHSRLKL